ncbi:MAG: methyltransferase domain-containing protein [Actinomycetota bacterium]|nr:methyltransferase domain-containing protein [Actinomycetota bacterium]
MADLMHKAEIQAMVRAAYLALDAPTGAGAGYYDIVQLAELPVGAIAWSLGVGNPLAHAVLPPGAVVLDVGCGAGIDTLLAARQVGPAGRVIGLDLLPEMCERGRGHAREAGITNVEFVEGEMEAVPLPDGSVDAVISNGVINLSGRKMRALFECARVLRPGGQLCLTDVTLDEDRLPPEVLTHPAAWSGCAAGAMSQPVLLRSLNRVGFVDLTVRERHPFGVADCARFPLFTPELLAVMRTSIPPAEQADVATCLTVTGRQPVQDVASSGLVASAPVRNEAAEPPVLESMEHDEIPVFDAGERHCGTGITQELRAWWAARPSGTQTVVSTRDPSTKADLPPLARLLGHTVEEITETDGTLRVTIRTKGH